MSSGVPWRTVADVLRVDWHPVDYACREPNGSMRPVWPGQTRMGLYCINCMAANCLLRSSYTPPGQEKTAHAFTLAVRDRSEETRRREERQRKRGQSACGRPLARSCWNCWGIRQTAGGYVCVKFGGDPVSVYHVSRSPGQKRAAACEYFRLRQEVDVKPLPQVPRERWVEASFLNMHNRRRVLRAQGLDWDRRPLRATCWNCAHLRKNGGYVCGLACGDKKSVTRQAMARREGCERYEIRLELEVKAIEGG